MSDFGTMLIARRTDGAAPGEGDRMRFARAIDALRAAAGAGRDAAGEPLRFRLIESRRPDGGKDPAVVLSEYWDEGIDEGEYELPIEAMLEQDRRVAESMREVLAAELGMAFDVTLVCGGW